MVFLASWEMYWLIDRLATEASEWRVVAWVLIPIATLAAMPALARRQEWPFGRFADDYRNALTPLAVFAAVWIVLTSIERGNPDPLRYVPLANPLELIQCVVLAGLLSWTRRIRSQEFERRFWYVWSILVFVVLNGMIARATHFYGEVQFGLEPLWSSATYQTAVSIVWTTVALASMSGASWLKHRAVWFSGAGVLAAVVLKLFLVDLIDINTVARIISFVGVGLLMLLVGYLSPLPPRLKEQS
jgi:uncharacterized membrane protein